MKRITTLSLALLICCLEAASATEIYEADICVYGGTASGVTAGLAAARRLYNEGIRDFVLLELEPEPPRVPQRLPKWGGGGGMRSGARFRAPPGL